MSLSHRHSLPPPFRDKSSGKTFIAISAPDFIFSQECLSPGGTPMKAAAPGFVYVEAPNIKAGQDVKMTKKPSEKCRRSVGAWMEKNLTPEPPPGHVPWSGEVTDKSNPSDNPKASAQKRSMSKSSSSTSTFEIPSCDSETLLGDSLPSDDSGKWFDGIVPPPIEVVMKANKRKSVSVVATRAKPSRAPVGTNIKKERRKTLCVTDMASRRRETPIIGRRLTQDHTNLISAARAAPVSRSQKALSTIVEMDDSVVLAIGRINTAMMQLQKEKERLECKPPSLVVSNSRTMHSISVEDFVTLDRSPPTLAQRRGKDVPGALQLPSNSPNKLDEYPDVPTPFQCSSTPDTPAFTKSIAPVYPELVLDKKMSAEQMINSLRYQVENFTPQNRNPLVTSIDDAEAWLKGELADEDGTDVLSSFPAVPNASAPSTAGGDSCESSMLAYMSSISREINASTSIVPGSPNLDQARQFVSSPESGHKLSSNLSVKQSTPRAIRNCHSLPSRTGSSPKPHRSILSDGNSSCHSGSGSVRKKVRFSSMEVETIDLPYLPIFDAPSSPSAFSKLPQLPPSPPSPARATFSSPPRRKPAPFASVFSPPRPASAEAQLPKSLVPVISPPKRLAPRAREMSPLNPNRIGTNGLASIPSPTTSPTKSFTSPISQRRFSTISGPIPSMKDNRSSITTPLPNKKYSLSQAAILPAGPLIFTTASAANEGGDILKQRNSFIGGNGNTPDLDRSRRQSMKVAGKENQQRLFPLGGLSISRKRSFTNLGLSPVKENHVSANAQVSIARDQDKEKVERKKAARRSMPFQSMLNRLRG